MAELGVAFRATDAYVTDGANDEWIDSNFFGGANYPTTLSTGLTVGWEASTGGTDGRNRSTGVNVRLAGLHYNKTGTEQITFRVDLPSGAGAYNVRAAFGEPTYAVSDDYYQFRDNTTAFATVSDVDGHPSSQWYDASGVLRTSASDWVTNNTRINRTFSSSILRLAMGRGTGAAGNSVIAYLSVESAGGGGALSGTSSATSTASGVIKGAGALSGASASTATALGVIKGAGALSGTSSSTTTASGTLNGAGALSGTSSASTTASGVVSGSGALTGTGSSTTTATGTLVGSGALSGTSSASSSASGVVANVVAVQIDFTSVGLSTHASGGGTNSIVQSNLLECSIASNESYYGLTETVIYTREIFISQEMKFSSAFDFGQGQKILRVRNFNGTTNDYDFIAQITSVGSSSQQNGVTDSYQITVSRNSGATWGTYNKTFIRSRWYTFQYRYFLNSAQGVADGVFQLWLDGVMIFNITGLDLVGAGTYNAVINRLLWGGWYSNSAGGNPDPHPEDAAGAQTTISYQMRNAYRSTAIIPYTEAVQDSSLSGSASSTTNASGTLSGSGALSGSGSAAGTASGTLSNLTPGGNALTGTASSTTSASGVLSGAGALSGSASATTSGSAFLQGAGSLSGASSAASSASGTLQGFSSLVGSASASSSASGTLSGSGALIGTSSALCVAVAVLSAIGSLTGSAAAGGSALGVLNDAASVSSPLGNVTFHSQSHFGIRYASKALFVSRVASKSTASIRESSK